MQEPQKIRPHEVALEGEPPANASVAFIGRIETPWLRREDCPRQGSLDGPECTITVFAPWDAGLAGVEAYDSLEILYWLHLSRRDLILQNPHHGPSARGAFSLRSPVRPNPIGLSQVRLVQRAGNQLIVRGLECVSGTPLIDIKPDRCLFSPPARQRGDGQG